VALLTGRLSIISAEKLDLLLHHMDRDKVKPEPIGDDGQFLKISGPLNQLTNAFTALLIAGEIQVLIGTRSLLGEGWDAPVVNSLILASSVGSYMLTNQMRGRAIRVPKNDNSKVSSIWHLVSINPKSEFGWSDFANLTKRFQTFVGLSEKDLTIESGFERMHAKAFEYSVAIPADVSAINNKQMLGRYNALPKVAERWQNAVELNPSARVLPSVKTNQVPYVRRLLLQHSFSHLLLQLSGLLIAAIIGNFSAQNDDPHKALLIVAGAMIGYLLYNFPKTFRVLRILLFHLPVDGSLKRIGKALAKALSEAGLLETPFRKMKVKVTKNDDGSFHISLNGGNFYESSLFADCLAEILAPIDNPRYLVVRKDKFLWQNRDDYHAVPMKFGVNKDTATVFHKSWNRYVNQTELLYTRSEDGRKRLLQARMKAFSSTFSEEVKRHDRWQ